MTRLICAECWPEVDERGQPDDPEGWCDCETGQQCRGPCRQRAHVPAVCPFLSAMVPMPTPARLVQAGDVIRQRDGRLVMVQWASQEDGHDAAPGMRKILTQFGIYAANALEVPAEYPVPVLVPYAEHVALLTLRENGIRGRVLARTPGGAS
jgi:hypothetical protein